MSRATSLIDEWTWYFLMSNVRLSCKTSTIFQNGHLDGSRKIVQQFRKEKLVYQKHSSQNTCVWEALGMFFWHAYFIIKKSLIVTHLDLVFCTNTNTSRHSSPWGFFVQYCSQLLQGQKQIINLAVFPHHHRLNIGLKIKTISCVFFQPSFACLIHILLIYSDCLDTSLSLLI